MAAIVDEVHAQVESVLDEDHGDFVRASNEDVMVKMLVTDNIAGAIIGREGSTIMELQRETGARVKVSQASDFFPGTSERTILLAGSMNSVLQVQELIWQKISEFSKSRDGSGGHNNNSVTGKLLIPYDCGGLIIGRGGTTIRYIQEESSARVQITSKENDASKISRERVMTISGTLDACVKASELVFLKMMEDPLTTYHNKSTSYPRLFPGAKLGEAVNSRVATAANMPGLSLPTGAETLSATSTIEIAVPNSLVGYILGKRGAMIREIQQISGAKVIVSKRPERKDGEDEADNDAIRTVTITGNPAQAQMAQLLVTQKLQLARNGNDRR